MGELTDGELVRMAKAGQREAFGELVKRHMRGVYALAYSFVPNHSDADDLSQQTFLSAYRSLASFRERSSFRTWLFRIAFNLCVNYVARRPPAMRSFEDTTPAQEVASSVRADSCSPIDAAVLDELQTLAANCVRELPLKLRTALRLVVSKGLSHKEAGKIIGCSTNTVSWRLYRAREILRTKLAPFLEGQ